jgi:hypothetical protein
MPSPVATPSWILVPRPSSKHGKQTDGNALETWTVPAADSVCFARVGREINFLSTFFCVCPVYNNVTIYNIVKPSSFLATHFALVSCLGYSSSLKMEAKYSSETSINFQ